MRKSLLILLFLSLLSGIFVNEANAQVQIDTVDKTKVYVVTTNDGGNFVGQITYFDSKEIIIITKEMGEVSIPKYQVKSIEELDPKNLNNLGEFIPNEVFSTRYFITTNGLPIEKGENYIQWNLYGPDLQFGVGKNFGIGVMTSWMGMPLIGSAKYSFSVGKSVNLGLGLLAGTGSWASIGSGGVLPFGVLTVGNRKSNLNISAGYVAFYLDQSQFGIADGNMSRPLCSIAGMTKVGKKVSLVFDSFIVGQGGSKTETQYNPTTGLYEDITVKRKGGALLIPGIRLQTQNNSAFQFGFAGLIVNNDLVPFPIPMVQWYRKI